MPFVLLLRLFAEATKHASHETPRCPETLEAGPVVEQGRQGVQNAGTETVARRSCFPIARFNGRRTAVRPPGTVLIKSRLKPTPPLPPYPQARSRLSMLYTAIKKLSKRGRNSTLHRFHQIAMTDNRHRGEPPPEVAPSAKTERDRKERSGQEGDRQPTFEETRKEFLNLLWKWVPRRLRLPLVALIVIGAILVPTRSFWYPPLDSWLHKPIPRLTIGGEILLDENKGLSETQVQLLDRNKNVISNATTDDTGYVTFNISSKDKIAILRCQDDNGRPVDFSLAIKEMTEGKTFYVRVDKKQIEYREK